MAQKNRNKYADESLKIIANPNKNYDVDLAHLQI